jgi:hypothetical protein
LRQRPNEVAETYALYTAGHPHVKSYLHISIWVNHYFPLVWCNLLAV